MQCPPERKYGRYRITFRKDDHVGNGRPTPHVEVWKGNRKIGNYDMASGRPINGQAFPRVNEFLGRYLKDRQVQKKVAEAIKSGFFDLSKPAGHYGAFPLGFKATVFVEILER